MKEILIKVSKATKMIYLDTKTIGVDSENLQSNLVFTFTDEFIDGEGRLEYQTDARKDYFILEKEEDKYVLPLRNVFMLKGKINLQLVITEAENEDGVPVFKSNIFYVYVGDSINAVEEAPEGYALWIDTANAKLIELDKFVDTIKELTKGYNEAIADLQARLEEYDKYDYLVLESGENDG